MIEKHLSLPKLTYPKNEKVGTKSFFGDQLDREKLALQLTGFFDRLKDGAVLAIDAPWGEGKTWFGLNWNKYLQEQEYRTVFIDAFKQDYIEDPFLLISAEILALSKDEKITEKLLASAVGVSKALIPLGTKILVNTLGQWALGTSNLSDQAQKILENAVDDSATTSSGWIKDRLTKHSNDKAIMEDFKNHLKTYASYDSKPLIVFIDELDRCKPTFAVELIERIKHFFDVPNVIFVLLLNRDQLEKAIKGVYGGDTDSVTYLNKFVNFFLTLPKVNPAEYQSENELKYFIDDLFKKYGFDRNGKTVDDIDYFAFLSKQFSLTLREIEGAIALFAFAFPVHILRPYVIYFIILKQKNYKHFNRLVSGEKDAHIEIANQINQIILIMQARQETKYNYFLNVCLEWHQAYIINFENLGDKFKNIYTQISEIEYGIEPQQILPNLANKISLNMDF